MQMFLTRLFSGSPAEWRDMWNNEVLPYLRGAQLVAGPGIRIDRRPAGTLIRSIPSGDGGNGGGGSFTLAAVVTSPAGGYGIGGYAPVTLNADGTYTIDTEGEPAAAVTPFI